MIFTITITTIFTITIIMTTVKDDNWSVPALQRSVAHKMSSEVPCQSFKTFQLIIIIVTTITIVIIIINIIVVIIIIWIGMPRRIPPH